jgi:NAD(P)-dependent dehydrogenase (short-subunit alcohol dehydrogenase family)
MRWDSPYGTRCHKTASSIHRNCDALSRRERLKNTVLITGATGALGSATAKEFVAHGWEVFAAARSPVPAPGCVPVELDVTDSESCVAAARQVAAHTDGLGAVINFAGVLDLGPLMEVSEERMQYVFDVNVFGTHRVNVAMFDLIRAGGGRIVNISSAAGRFRAGITSGPYAMSKHALEAYSDSLRQELQFLGVPVIVVEPGPFRGQMSQSIPQRLADSVRPDSPFEPIIEFTKRTSAHEEKNARDPRTLARSVYRAVTTKHPRPRYLVNGGMQSRVMDLLPRRVADGLIRLVVR